MVVFPHLGLIGVLAVALAARLIYLRWFKTFPPGDVFNFITIAQGIPQGIYSADERRLPFYPLLILMAHTVLEWEYAGLVVAVAASLAGLLALYTLGRTLGFSKTALVALLLVLQTHPQLMTATRGYADTTLFALLPATLLALFRARTWKGVVLVGVLCGAMALTRYEGLAAAAVLLPLWFLFPVGRPRRYAAIAVLVWILSLTPYLLISAANNRPPFGVGYVADIEGPEGYGSANFREFWDSGRTIWQRNGLFGAWKIPYAIAREIAEDPFATPRILAARLTAPGEPLALFALLGALVLLRRRWPVLLFLLAATAAASAPPAWFNPLRRYDIVVLPLLFLLAASGVSAIQSLLERGTAFGGSAGRAIRWLAGFAFATVAAGFWTATYAEEVRNRQLKHNGREYAYYQAIHAARALQGKILFERAGITAEFYFGARGVYLLDQFIRAGVPPQEILPRLRVEGVRYAVVSESHAKAFPFLDGPSVREVSLFEWPRPGGDISRATIYEILIAENR